MITKLFKLLYSEDRISQGLLALRVGIGISFMIHGFPKIFMGGAPHLSEAMTKAGIPGGIIGAYMAGCAEFFGGIALIVGLLFLPAMIVMALNMLVALLFHLGFNDPFVTYSHALESLILFIGLAISGPGRYSLDNILFGQNISEECTGKDLVHSVATPV